MQSQCQLWNSLLVLCVVVLCSGCSGSHQPPRTASIEAFQKYYSSTKWYWSPDVVGLPQDISGYKPMDANRGGQIHLVSDDEKRLIRYTEMEPRVGLKTFYGHGVIQRVEGVEAPFFQIKGKSDMFIGFFDGRLFRIEVVNSGEDPARVRREVTALGLEVLTRATATSKHNAH